jgi:hypothetical protein
MKKWLNDLYAEILKYGFNPGTGPGPGPGPTPEPEPYSNIYHGKYLGNTYTTEQKQAIADGSFKDLNIGDYWTINGINWRIADVDYYYNVGDNAFTKHHIVVVPDTILYEAKMNSYDETNGCYSGSEMYTNNLDEARTAFDNAFGSSCIPTHRGLFARGSGVDDWYWRDMKVELMSEEQVYGHSVWGSANHNGYDVGTQKVQFRLFSLDKTKINIRQTYWLTNVKSNTHFSRVTNDGGPDSYRANGSFGVRPFACIVGDSEQ